jgi:hypothetical protein
MSALVEEQFEARRAAFIGRAMSLLTANADAHR